MPIYEYHCNQCKKEFEKLVFASDDDHIVCPDCSTDDIIKKMSAASVMGSSTDNCAPGSPQGFS